MPTIHKNTKRNAEISRWKKYFDMVKVKESKMDVVTDEKQIDEVLSRGMKEIFPKKEELKKVLMSGKRLRLYCGIDPSADFLHVGHFIWMKKLARFQKLGHQVIFMIGAFTGMIGDPDKIYTRTPLTKEQVWDNFQNYKETASKILDFNWERNPITILNNYDWLSQTTLEDWLQIMGKVTLQHILSHDMFETRLKENKPIRLHEISYPLMQGFDGVVMQVDLEVGGSDQTFNMLTGRILSREILGKDKFVLTLKLLTDPTGKKMGKTTGNAISSLDTPEDMFGKIMSWPDESLFDSFEMLTDVNLDEFSKKRMSKDPMKFKKILAFEVVKMLTDDKTAQKAQEYFEKTVQKGEMPDKMKEIKYSFEKEALPFAKFLVKKGFIASNADAKRLITQGGLQIDGQKVNKLNQKLSLKPRSVVQIGKITFIRIVVYKLILLNNNIYRIICKKYKKTLRFFRYI
jgi:tyrosyl-tRNA synthetase